MVIVNAELHAQRCVCERVAENLLVRGPSSRSRRCLALCWWSVSTSLHCPCSRLFRSEHAGATSRPRTPLTTPLTLWRRVHERSRREALVTSKASRSSSCLFICSSAHDSCHGSACGPPSVFQSHLSPHVCGRASCGLVLCISVVSSFRLCVASVVELSHVQQVSEHALASRLSALHECHQGLSVSSLESRCIDHCGEGIHEAPQVALVCLVLQRRWVVVSSGPLHKASARS